MIAIALLSLFGGLLLVEALGDDGATDSPEESDADSEAVVSRQPDSALDLSLTTGNGDDILRTGSGNDDLTTGGGEDWLDGGHGDDTLDGGDGNDYLDAGHGDDVLNAGAGNDTVYGDDGSNLVTLGPGDDSYLNRDSDDVIYAGDGDDTITTRAGAHVVRAGDGNDVWTETAEGWETWELYENPRFERVTDSIYGGSGDDTLMSSYGENRLYGEEGDDYLDAIDSYFVFLQNDTLEGGAGQDTLAGNNGDILSGGEGVDTFVTRLEFNGEEEYRGTVSVTDFDPDTEVLWVYSDLDPDATRDDIRIDRSGADAMIWIGNSSAVLIQGVLPSELNETNLRIGAPPE